MHELSLALEVCRLTSERLVGVDGRLVRVGVEVGQEAGVELGNFRFCLETLLRDPPFAGAAAAIDSTAGDALRLTYLEVDDGHPND